MEIVLISKSNGALGRMQLRWYAIAFGVAVLMVAASGVFFIGYEEGRDRTADRLLNDAGHALTFWQREISSNRKFLKILRTDFDADLATLSSKVGSLQAHIVRLDALAERVIGVAQLDSEEFGLSDSPAIGGPAQSEQHQPRWHALLVNLESLEDEISSREDRLDALNVLMMDRKLQESMHPEGDPVSEGWISSRFGYRTDPVSGSREFHGGIDFAGREGVNVSAVGGGIVTWSGERWGYGNLVEISHGNGYVTRYAHNKKNLVKIGEKVSRNQTIALLGSTGRSTGPHVHFEVIKDGKVVNPRNFIDKNASQ